MQDTETTEQETESYDDNIAGEAWVGLAVAEVEDSNLPGSFEFQGILLNKDQDNNITVEVSDAAGNLASFSGMVFADSSKPQLSLAELPEYADSNSFELNVNITENCTYEVFVNNQSSMTGEGNVIKTTLSLTEGENKIKISVIDIAGWNVVKEFILKADTQAPSVKIEVEKGNEFYQGRAESDVHGDTEPGAIVYLYVYESSVYDSQPTFNDAWMKTTADKNGSFTFKEVDFEHQPISLKKFGPKSVPSGLESYSLHGIEQLAQQQQQTKQLFIIAEDISGKSGYAQETITLKTCYSMNFGFAVESIQQFQAPLRLDPGMMDRGEQTITAVFNLSYMGDGRAKTDLGTGREIEAAYEVVDVQFEKACTSGMMDDEKFKLGCQIFPQRPIKKMPNGDNTAWYISYNLQSAEKLSETEDSFWNEFKKRQLIFPMKLRVNYRERDSAGNLGPTKTQAVCYDLSYFVDIPLDSKDYLPDWLADEGLTAMNWTIDKLATAEKYLDTAIMVTGIAAVAAFLAKLVVGYIRIVVSKFEVYGDKMEKDEDKKCPDNHDKLLMKSTIESWKKFPGNVSSEVMNAKTLDDLCPSTKGMWKVEAVLDQTVRWTWDRVFCRPVPAGWTADKEWREVETVKKAQQQCAATSKGIPLRKVEDCGNLIEKNQGMINSQVVSGVNVDLYNNLKAKGSFVCYYNSVNNQLYHVTGSTELSEQNIVTLQRIAPHGRTLESASMGYADTLLAFKPRDSKDFIVGSDKSCAATCRNERNPGYSADTELGDEFGCYKEVNVGGGKVNYINTEGDKISGARYSAGYTKDCFIDGNGASTDESTGLLQCVCKGEVNAMVTYQGARTAAKATGDGAEEWIYRQHKIYKKRTGQGTYYPEWRYYTKRDMSSAFGADHLLDYVGAGKKYHEVNPHTQHIGAFQTICLSGIRARIVMLKNILIGVTGCIQEAKVTGLRDAGVCKTIFSQAICGLLYKAIAYLASDCSPLTMKDAGPKGTFDDVAAGSKIIFGSVMDAMQESTSDIMDDYGGNSAVKQMFGTGVKGFAQSMCMAAFGYDFPLGADFIMDAAYSFPMKTTAHAIPAERELMTFNPATGTAVYNYNIGAMVLPGCSVRRVDAFLKCVGPEDQAHDDIFCGDQKCDCLQATEISSTLEGEKMKRLEAGRLTNLKPGSFVDLNIKSPQQIDSHYRYDHVVVDVKLGPHESPDACFDEGHKDGKFYFPITDVSGPGAFTCNIDYLTGRYNCPAIMGMFGGKSGAYFEDPYLTCYDKYSDSFVSCKTPNIFSKGDQIRVKLHLVTDGEKYCLKKSYSGYGGMQQQGLAEAIPQGIDGAHALTFNLGTVGDQSFAGSSVLSLGGNSASGCNPNPRGSFSNEMSHQELVFNYNKLDNGNYKITLPGGVTANKDLNSISSGDLLNTEFNIMGTTFTNMIGNPQDINGQCVYRITPSSGYTQNKASIRFIAELLEVDQMGGCMSAMIPLKSSAFGKSQIDETIVLQRQDAVSQVASKLHQEFINENHAYVMQEANNIINLKGNDMNDALAIYYLVADLIVQYGNQWETLNKDICNYLNIFIKRDYIDHTTGTAYPSSVTEKEEYKKIDKYLRVINGKLNCGISDGKTVGTSGTVKTGSTGPLCGQNGTISNFAKPANWSSYTCQLKTGGKCLGYLNYTTSGSGRGCPGTKLCCPAATT